MIHVYLPTDELEVLLLQLRRVASHPLTEILRNELIVRYTYPCKFNEINKRIEKSIHRSSSFTKKCTPEIGGNHYFI